MSLELLAWAKIGDRTEIRYQVSSSRVVEFTIGGADGLTLDTTERGLENLVRVGTMALQELQAKRGPTPTT